MKLMIPVINNNLEKSDASIHVHFLAEFRKKQVTKQFFWHEFLLNENVAYDICWVVLIHFLFSHADAANKLGPQSQLDLTGYTGRNLMRSSRSV